MKPLVAVSIALALAACGARPWNDDETARIAEIMACDRFNPDLPEARGIPLHQMPAQARPSPRSLSLSEEKGGRKLREDVAKVSRKKPGATARRSDRDRAPPKKP